DPVAATIADHGLPHAQLPLPRDLYGERTNSHGLDLAAEASLRALQLGLSAAPLSFTAAPMLGGVSEESSAQAVVRADSAPRHDSMRRLDSKPMRNPAAHDDVVGTVVDATVDDVTLAVGIAVGAGAMWSRQRADERAQVLERAADLLEDDQPQLIAIAVREAGKTIGNGLGEVREAADFCRYYAAQARLELSGDAYGPIGPVVCITPWNFPLAIFVGEISAALAAGNPVLAKPAEQTPLMAAAVVALFHQAGVPAAALQLLPGPGAIVGQALVADPRIHGVLFTGSNPVALSINRQLAARADAPVLIAETGGQNAMIVDSSALPEQVVADAIVSAFDSAGQRCSALRILCLQSEVADRIVAMLEGAMRELRVGDPRHLTTDVGPVIDADAQGALLAHIDRMRVAGMRVVQVVLPPACVNGTFVPPTLIEIDRIERLEREVFGPVLHVIRYERDALPQLIDAINATGYGLTHGIQSRIDETVDEIVGRVRAGNIYVNRNVIGAVVGVQPFGGDGLSGTGPKAGGPFYMRRLVRRLYVATAGPEQAIGDATDILLPGPTGETNRWSTHPRGVVACVAPDAARLREQIGIARATGNRVLLARSPITERIMLELGASFCELADDWSRIKPDAWLIAGDDTEVHALRLRLAANDGPIVPVIARDTAGGYDSERLVLERVVTINTTASGGNAELLAATV
ncbi:MAG: L-glutamate gamma-semialdehyde dehydrogenase, partial [Betaproteobacteria bacterium]